MKQGQPNPIDEERLRLFPKRDHREYKRQADGGMNDAELIAEMRRSGDLKKLDPSRFPLPSVEVGAERPKEASQGLGFNRGDRVTVKEDNPIGPDIRYARVISVFAGFVRTDLGIYPAYRVRHARSTRKP